MKCLLCIFTIYIKAKIIVNKIQPHRNCPIHFLWRIIFVLTNYRQLLLYISYEHWYGLYDYSLCISHSLLVIRGTPSHWTGLLRLIVCYTVLLYHHTYACTCYYELAILQGTAKRILSTWQQSEAYKDTYEHVWSCIVVAMVISYWWFVGLGTVILWHWWY